MKLKKQISPRAKNSILQALGAADVYVFGGVAVGAGAYLGRAGVRAASAVVVRGALAARELAPLLADGRLLVVLLLLLLIRQN